jgi:hypothetical protein
VTRHKPKWGQPHFETAPPLLTKAGVTRGTNPEVGVSGVFFKRTSRARKD